jgi:N-acetylmuramoyl-L-alanine amidase
LVDEEKRAWHAGRSYWRGKEALNDSSIGIELDNPGDKPFPKEQMKGLKALCLDIILRYSIQPYNIVAHSDIAPDRKADPNSNFEWEYLYSHQIGLYSEINLSKNKNLLRPNSKSNKVLDLKGRLFKFGYRITNLTMDFDHELLQVIHAFKRRFVPETYHINFWDELSDQRLDDLLQQIKL